MYSKSDRLTAMIEALIKAMVRLLRHIGLVDQAGNNTYWSYDVENRQTRKTYADSTHWDYTYDAEGRLTSRTDAKDQTTVYQYDAVGNLTNIKNNATFEFGTAKLPAKDSFGSPTGGGNFYLFKKSTPAQREAAFRFIKWVTTPQRAAWWVMSHTLPTGILSLLLVVLPGLGWLYFLPVLAITVDLFYRNIQLIRDPSPLHARKLFMSSNYYLYLIHISEPTSPS
mgnify:CR=1 FL=1